MSSSPSATKRISFARRASVMASLVNAQSSSSSSAIRIVIGVARLGMDCGRIRLTSMAVPLEMLRFRDRLADRQPDGERRALTGSALRVDRAAVAVDDLAAECEADTGARVAPTAMEALEHPEDPGVVARLEADAVVRDLEFGEAPPDLAADADLRGHALAVELDS